MCWSFSLQFSFVIAPRGKFQCDRKGSFFQLLFNYNRTVAQFKVERISIYSLSSCDKDEIGKTSLFLYQNIIQMESVVVSIKIIRLRMIKGKLNLALSQHTLSADVESIRKILSSIY